MGGLCLIEILEAFTVLISVSTLHAWLSQIEPRVHIQNQGTPFSSSFSSGISLTSSPRVNSSWFLWLERHVSVKILTACSNTTLKLGPALRIKLPKKRRKKKKKETYHPPKPISFYLLSQFLGSLFFPYFCQSFQLPLVERIGYSALTLPWQNQNLLTHLFLTWRAFKDPAESCRRANYVLSPNCPLYSEKHLQALFWFENLTQNSKSHYKQGNPLSMLKRVCLRLAQSILFYFFFQVQTINLEGRVELCNYFYILLFLAVKEKITFSTHMYIV